MKSELTKARNYCFSIWVSSKSEAVSRPLLQVTCHTSLPHSHQQRAASSLALSKLWLQEYVDVKNRVPALLYWSKIMLPGSLQLPVNWREQSEFFLLVFFPLFLHKPITPVRLFPPEFLFFRRLLGFYFLPVGSNSKGCNPSQCVSQI